MTRIHEHKNTITKRHSERQKKRIRMMKIRRTVFFSVLASILLIIILFYTPLFKIRSVEVTGNNKIQTEDVLNTIGETEGKNLFRFRAGSAKRKLKKSPYIEDVDIDRVVFKSKLKIDIKEAEEAACIAGGSGYIIINPQTKVLSESTGKPENVPEISGVTLTSIEIGKEIKTDDKEKFEIVRNFLSEMEKLDLLKGVRSVSVANVANITFNYEDRLDAVCGSRVDLNKKLEFFKSAINSSRLTENSRGTIDLTTVGKAIYTP